MKYDKYGDPIIETDEKLDSRSQTAFLVMIGIQLLLVVLNILIVLIPVLNLYLCFVTAPIYMFIYITFLKGYSNKKEQTRLPGYCKTMTVLSPVLYVITAFLAIFGGM